MIRATRRLGRPRLASLGPWLTAVLALLVSVQSAAAAQQSRKFGTEGVEIEGYAGFLAPNEPQFVAGESGFNLEDREVFFGMRMGYTFRFSLFAQAEFGYSPLTFFQASGGTNVNTLLFGGSLGYNVPLSTGFQAFILGGAGVMHWDADLMAHENELRLHFGGGFRVFPTSGVAIRIEARDNVIPATMTQIRRDLNPGLQIDDDLTHNLEVTAGISLFFSRRRDTDRDGVLDEYDACPDTPKGVGTDARGCVLDSDADAVPDYRDRCPNTPAGVAVDETGCALDGDGDGVADAVDRCPNTPAGARVNEEGCATDRDADGVPDGLDRCPNTPAGKDVNAEGCSRIEAGLEAGRLILRNVYFDTGRATLRLESRGVLDEVAAALIDRPKLRIEIQGHTDSVGSADYNLRLSRRRALAVFNYLSTFSGLDMSRFTITGYGESSPIASNATEGGRQENRRVEFVVLSRE